MVLQMANNATSVMSFDILMFWYTDVFLFGYRCKELFVQVLPPSTPPITITLARSSPSPFTCKYFRPRLRLRVSL